MAPQKETQDGSHRKANEAKKKNNYEFRCRNLKVNTPPEGIDDILILAWIGTSLKH